MFFGLCNSPATFQTMTDNIFDDLIMEGVVVVYLDDILIFTETLEKHQKVTQRVMELLQKHNLLAWMRRKMTWVMIGMLSSVL